LPVRFAVEIAIAILENLGDYVQWRARQVAGPKRAMRCKAACRTDQFLTLAIKEFNATRVEAERGDSGSARVSERNDRC